MTIYNDDLAPIYEKFPNISDLDAKILFLIQDGFKYSAIQRFLGNPSKQYIKNVLKKYN